MVSPSAGVAVPACSCASPEAPLTSAMPVAVPPATNVRRFMTFLRTCVDRSAGWSVRSVASGQWPGSSPGARLTPSSVTHSATTIDFMRVRRAHLGDDVLQLIEGGGNALLKAHANVLVLHGD